MTPHVRSEKRNSPEAEEQRVRRLLLPALWLWYARFWALRWLVIRIFIPA